MDVRRFVAAVLCIVAVVASPSGIAALTPEPVADMAYDAYGTANEVVDNAWPAVDEARTALAEAFAPAVAAENAIYATEYEILLEAWPIAEPAYVAIAEAYAPIAQAQFSIGQDVNVQVTETSGAAVAATPPEVRFLYDQAKDSLYDLVKQVKGMKEPDSMTETHWRVPIRAPPTELASGEDTQTLFALAQMRAFARDDETESAPPLAHGVPRVTGFETGTSPATIGAERPAVLWLVVSSLALAVFGAALYSRLRRDAVREQSLRQRILATLASRPGMRKGALAEHLGVHATTIRYHLHVLARTGAISERESFGHTLYYPAGNERREGMPDATPPAAQRLHETVASNPGISLRSARLAIGLDRSTAHYHLRRLGEQGFVRAERRGNALHLFPGDRV